MSLEERKPCRSTSGPVAGQAPHGDEHDTIPLVTPSRIGWAEAHSHRDRPHLRRDPLRVYATRAFLLDMLVVLTAGITGFVLRWAIPYSVEINDPTYVSLVFVVVASWMIVLVLRGAYDTRVLGVGSEEFKRVVSATATVFGAVAIVVFALKLDLSRGFVLITFSLGLLLLLVVRWSLRALAAARAPLRALPAPHGRHRRRPRDERDRRHARPRSGRGLHGRRHDPRARGRRDGRPGSTPGSTRS